MENSSAQAFRDENYLLHRAKFSIILSLQIPAFALNLLILIFFIRNRRALRAPQYPALLILLIVNFIQLSSTLPLDVRFFFLGYVSPATPSFCTFWTFLEFTLNEVSEYLIAIISVQRHMLIFNSHILRIPRMRIILHHLPLLLCLTYPAIFYLFAILLYPCDGTQYDYSNNVCGLTACYLVYDKVLSTLDWSVNIGLPIFIDVSANILLITRVIRQRLRRNQPLPWRKQRRMTVQLFCLSSLYLVGWSPCFIVSLIQILCYPTFLAQIQIDYLIDLNYLINLFLPWVCLGLIPELLTWIKRLCQCAQATNQVTAAAPKRLPNDQQTTNN